VQQVAQWIQSELLLQGLEDVGPSVERVCIFAEAFGHVMDWLPTYRPLLLLIQREYNGLISKLREEVHAVEAMGCRMKTIKAESLHFVTQSMTSIKKGVSETQQNLRILDAENKRLTQERKELDTKMASLAQDHHEERKQVEEYHTTNMDMVRLVRRLETEIEVLHRSEQDSNSQIGHLSMKVKEKDLRIQAVEQQLQAENKKVMAMVSMEDHKDLEEKLQRSDSQCRELAERIEAVQHNYKQLLETYTKGTGQHFSDKDVSSMEARPLTPRPAWHHCHGSLDPDSGSSAVNAAAVQELLQHVLTSSRSLLSAYGLLAVANKSTVFQTYVHQPAVTKVAGDNVEVPLQSHFDMTMDEGDVIEVDPHDLNANPKLPEAFQLELLDQQEDPESCRFANMRFSRTKVLSFLDSLLQLRLRRGGVSSTRPFCDFMYDNLPDGIKGTAEANGYYVNMFAAARRYGAEPDFLSYLLLFSGKISDSVVADNKSLCGRIRSIFATLFDKAGPSRTVSKQKLFHGLREVLPHKGKEMWQELMSFFPPGGPETMVNYEALLLDDRLVLSPVVYALRLQHLEEALGLSERFEAIMQECCGPNGSSRVKFKDLEAALESSQTFAGLSRQDLAAAFNTSTSDLHPGVSVAADRCLAMLKQSALYRTLFYPLLSEKPDDMHLLRSRLESLEVHRKAAAAKEDLSPDSVAM